MEITEAHTKCRRELIALVGKIATDDCIATVVQRGTHGPKISCPKSMVTGQNKNGTFTKLTLLCLSSMMLWDKYVSFAGHKVLKTKTECLDKLTS